MAKKQIKQPNPGARRGKAAPSEPARRRINEELRSSNEDYQINKKLQSANDELETSREELHSVNEELQTVNAELTHRVSDLARANSDLRNLLEATQIATVFLDNDLRVRSFTPAATDIFHLLESDVGRPIEHLGSTVSYPELGEDVRKVLATLGSVEREVTSREEGHYIARVHPYRSADNLLVGAVLTFLDVTGTVKAEAALRESEARLRVLLSELQHRVRNTLAVVKSIAKRTAQSTDTAEEMADHLVGRLDAFARVQSAVARNPDAGIDLASLIADELLAHAVHEGDGLTMKGPTILLKPKAAESMSLAIHELTTNAVKHGALSDKQGKIAVKWRVTGADGEKRLLFDWNEEAPNQDVNHGAQDGFGMELLARILPHDLGAKTNMDFRPHGVRFNLELPYEHLMVRAGDGLASA